MSVLLFPGQGTQHTGMGMALGRAFAAAVRPAWDAAEALDPALPGLLRRGPDAVLARTENAQPAVTTVNIAALLVLGEAGGEVTSVAGHSVGLLSALVAAGTLTGPAALRLAAARGALMGRLPTGSAMASVRGIPRARVDDLARAVTAEGLGTVVTGLVNGPDNVVLSGDRAALGVAGERAAQAGGQVTPLAVSHAFHSPFMAPARDDWAAVVAAQVLAPPRVPVVADLSGELCTTVADLRTLLVEQLTSTVRWDLVCERITGGSDRNAVEVGDSRTLRAFARAYPAMSVASMGDPQVLARIRAGRPVHTRVAVAPVAS